MRAVEKFRGVPQLLWSSRDNLWAGRADDRCGMGCLDSGTSVSSFSFKNPHVKIIPADGKMWRRRDKAVQASIECQPEIQYVRCHNIKIFQ